MAVENLGILAPFVILFFFVALAVVIFLVIAWIVMLIDCIQRDFKDGSSRVAWILILIFLSVIGLALYYFMVYRKGRSRSRRR